MGKLLEELTYYFNNTPQEQLDRDWEEIKHLNENYMEMKVNEEYQKVIDKLHKVLEYIKNNNSESLIAENLTSECINTIKQLGSRVVLNKDAEQFNNITTDMLKTYIKKNHDYGNSFEQSLDKFGLIAGVIRIGDKMNRIESLTTKEAEVKDEAIKDTLLDMANYCILSVMWLNKQSE